MVNDGHLMNSWCVSRPKSSPKIATEFSSGPLFLDQGRPSAGCQLPLCLTPNTGCLEMAADLKNDHFPQDFLPGDWHPVDSYWSQLGIRKGMMSTG